MIHWVTHAGGMVIHRDAVVFYFRCAFPVSFHQVARPPCSFCFRGELCCRGESRSWLYARKETGSGVLKAPCLRALSWAGRSVGLLGRGSRELWKNRKQEVDFLRLVDPVVCFFGVPNAVAGLDGGMWSAREAVCFTQGTPALIKNALAPKSDEASCPWVSFKNANLSKFPGKWSLEWLLTCKR